MKLINENGGVFSGAFQSETTDIVVLTKLVFFFINLIILSKMLREIYLHIYDYTYIYIQKSLYTISRNSLIILKPRPCKVSSLIWLILLVL